ncbi:MAG TPA: TadE/TadG family type IV pilus assembly protein [Pirellulales bacterium]|nr:TadE/TadG family type IV pilus assembly protein [Pirellulales bacterium]
MNRTRHQVRRARERRGTALVEFAMVAPVFFLFMVGAIEFGRAIMVQEVLTDASREGARIGSVDGTQASDATAAANAYLSAMTISGATVSVSPANLGSSTPSGTQVTVTVSISYRSVSWVPAPWFLGSATLTANTVMQRQATPMQ